MRKRHGRWTCRQCGTVIDVPRGRRPRVTIVAASGQPNVRVLMVDQREVHRCVIG